MEKEINKMILVFIAFPKSYSMVQQVKVTRNTRISSFIQFYCVLDLRLNHRMWKCFIFTPNEITRKFIEYSVSFTPLNALHFFHAGVGKQRTRYTVLSSLAHAPIHIYFSNVTSVNKPLRIFSISRSLKFPLQIVLNAFELQTNKRKRAS